MTSEPPISDARCVLSLLPLDRFVVEEHIL